MRRNMACTIRTSVLEWSIGVREIQYVCSQAPSPGFSCLESWLYGVGMRSRDVEHGLHAFTRDRPRPVSTPAGAVRSVFAATPRIRSVDVATSARDPQLRLDSWRGKTRQPIRWVSTDRVPPNFPRHALAGLGEKHNPPIVCARELAFFHSSPLPFTTTPAFPSSRVLFVRRQRLIAPLHTLAPRARDTSKQTNL